MARLNRVLGSQQYEIDLLKEGDYWAALLAKAHVSMADKISWPFCLWASVDGIKPAETQKKNEQNMQKHWFRQIQWSLKPMSRKCEKNWSFWISFNQRRCAGTHHITSTSTSLDFSQFFILVLLFKWTASVFFFVFFSADLTNANPCPSPQAMKETGCCRGEMCR